MTEPKNEPTIRGEVLNEARALIEGDRNKTYGSPTQNFQNTADIWNVLLGHKLKGGQKIEAYEVATLMVALKLARTVAEPKRDNFVDMAGYAACGHETQVEVARKLLERNKVAISSSMVADFEDWMAEREASKLWTGTYQSPEPPAHVVQLRRTNGSSDANPGEFLWRRGGNRWSWEDQSDFDPDEWDEFLQNPEGLGFKWGATTVTGYEFEEVPQS
jgi:uncharacterized protein DUF6378